MNPFQKGDLPIESVATVYVSSEEADHPIECVFDEQRGPGGTRWVAGEDGEQVVIVAFDHHRLSIRSLLRSKNVTFIEPRKSSWPCQKMAAWRTRNYAAKSSISVRTAQRLSVRNGRFQSRTLPMYDSR